MLQPVVRHIDAVSERQLQLLVAELHRPEYDMYGELAALVAYRFKFQELQLNVKGCIRHFKGAGDPGIRLKLVNSTMGAEYHVAFGIGCFKLIAAVLLVFKFQHFGSHPLLHQAGLGIGLKK